MLLLLLLLHRACSLATTTSGPPRRRQRMPSLAKKLEATDLECRLCLEGKGEGPTFHLGLGTFRVPMALHEANRVKLAEMMPEGSQGVALLQGGDQETRYDTDHEPVFRQESYFQYLFGVSEAGCFGAVSLPECQGDALRAGAGRGLRGLLWPLPVAGGLQGGVRGGGGAIPARAARMARGGAGRAGRALPAPRTEQRLGQLGAAGGLRGSTVPLRRDARRSALFGALAEARVTKSARGGRGDALRELGLKSDGPRRGHAPPRGPG